MSSRFAHNFGRTLASLIRSWRALQIELVQLERPDLLLLGVGVIVSAGHQVVSASLQDASLPNLHHAVGVGKRTPLLSLEVVVEGRAGTGAGSALDPLRQVCLSILSS